MSLYKKSILFFVCISILTAGCAQTSQSAAVTNTPPPARTGNLTPYTSPTPQMPPAAQEAPSTATPLPSTTPTPQTHEVVKGEDMSGIALRYGIELAELLAANPTVNPRFMSIGTVLIIPSSRSKTPTLPLEDSGSPLQTPTPISVEASSVNCTMGEDGGVWCFQAVRNRQAYPLEGLIALFQMTDGQGKPVRAQNAFLPLDLLPPGAVLPLAAYFPPYADMPQSFTVSSQLLSALPNRDDGRYLRCSTHNEKVMVSPDGLTADITLNVVNDQADTRARRIWVAAIAYDRSEQITGVRRWEKPDEDPIATGQAQPVSLRLYSAAGEISRVEITAECRP